MCSPLSGPEDDVQPTIGIHDVLRHLPHLEREGSLLEGFLHGVAAEHPQVSPLLGGGAVTELRGERSKGSLSRSDLRAVTLQQVSSLLLRPCDPVSAPGGGPPGARVLHEEVRALHLVGAGLGRGRLRGLRRGVPLALLRQLVQEVRLARRSADPLFPACRKLNLLVCHYSEPLAISGQ